LVIKHDTCQPAPDIKVLYKQFSHLGGSDSTSAQPTLVRRSRIAGRISSCTSPRHVQKMASHCFDGGLTGSAHQHKPAAVSPNGQKNSKPKKTKDRHTLSTRMAVRPLPLYPHALMGLATYLFHQQ
jgi:hypothetical protein